MHPKIEEAQREIVELFNEKPKNGIARINKNFSMEKKNLDLEAVGDYLSGPEQQNKEVLKYFTQEIDRLVESFSEGYCRQNPDGQIANKEAAYVLAFATIMLATDLHNPSIETGKKMTLQQFKNNTRICQS